MGHCIDEMIMILVCDVCHCQAFASLISYTITTHRNTVRMEIMHIRGMEQLVVSITLDIKAGLSLWCAAVCPHQYCAARVWFQVPVH